MTLDDFTVSFSDLNQMKLLSDWSWLTLDKYLPILLTSSGDAFLQYLENESIYCLDTAEGKLERIASSIFEFEQLLKDSEFVANYFAVQMVGDLVQSGKVLEERQIYSLTKPYVLGGEYTLENIAVADVEVHFSLLGQIHNKVKDLPSGTVVGKIDIERI